MPENLDQEARVDDERRRELAEVGRAAYEAAMLEAKSILRSIGYGSAAPSAGEPQEMKCSA